MSKTVSIRMYNVGFGDCFLITLPAKRTVLVDAGFHSQGKGKFSGNELPDQILTDVMSIKGEPRIDVVIATHRHQDHVFSFNSKKWAQFEVGEVWLPWVEDRSNEQASRLWKKQQNFAMQLAAAMPTFSLDAGTRKNVEFMLWNAGINNLASIDDAQGFEAGAWSNAGALDCLHEGFARRDRLRPEVRGQPLDLVADRRDHEDDVRQGEPIGGRFAVVTPAGVVLDRPPRRGLLEDEDRAIGRPRANPGTRRNRLDLLRWRVAA